MQDLPTKLYIIKEIKREKTKISGKTDSVHESKDRYFKTELTPSKISLLIQNIGRCYEQKGPQNTRTLKAQTLVSNCYSVAKLCPIPCNHGR